MAPAGADTYTRSPTSCPPIRPPTRNNSMPNATHKKTEPGTTTVRCMMSAYLGGRCPLLTEPLCRLPAGVAAAAAAAVGVPVAAACGGPRREARCGRLLAPTRSCCACWGELRWRLRLLLPDAGPAAAPAAGATPAGTGTSTLLGPGAGSCAERGTSAACCCTNAKPAEAGSVRVAA